MPPLNSIRAVANALTHVYTPDTHVHVTVHAVCTHPPELREYAEHCNFATSPRDDGHAVLFAMFKDEGKRRGHAAVYTSRF